MVFSESDPQNPCAKIICHKFSRKFHDCGKIIEFQETLECRSRADKVPFMISKNCRYIYQKYLPDITTSVPGVIISLIFRTTCWLYDKANFTLTNYYHYTLCHIVVKINISTCISSGQKCFQTCCRGSDIKLRNPDPR